MKLDDILNLNEEGEFWARVTITFNIYLKDAYGIYAAIDTRRYNRITIKGNTVEPLALNSVYEMRLMRSYNKVRKSMDIEILEAYEVDFEDSYEERLFLHATRMTHDSLEEHANRVKLDDYVREVVGYHVNYRDAKRLVFRYGKQTITYIANDPYVLLDLANYISFDECDTIANHLGYNIISPIRITSAIRESIKEYCNETGHTCCPVSVVKQKAKGKLNYYLSKDEMYTLANNTEKYFDYTVFNFTNMVSLTELKQVISERRPYLFAEVGEELIDDELQNINNINKFELDFIGDIEVVQLSETIDQELNIASHLKEMQEDRSGMYDPTSISSEITRWEQNTNIALTDSQKDAIKSILTYKTGGFYIINGSAGTGKTTVIKAILDIQKNTTSDNIRLVAPTGRAANVLASAVDLPATTIHKLLGYDPETNTFSVNGQDIYHLINADILVVDETSMLDTWLCSCLLDAVDTKRTKVIFLGDDRQLPSVGPGSVLKDILNSYADVTTLTEVKRQGANSGILKNAISILNGKDLKQFNDSRILQKADSDDQIKNIISACNSALKRYSSKDIQVLVPMKVGNVGTRNLNRLLQPIFNPNFQNSGMKVEEGESYIINNKYYKNYFHVGDKVISNQNLYGISRYAKDDTFVMPSSIFVRHSGANKMVEEARGLIVNCDVTNGEIGEITDIRECDILVRNKNGVILGVNHVTRIVVKYPSLTNKNQFDYVYYDDKSDAISLAYAITIHKSQGSSWPCTITAIHQSHSRMISNELLYVAATRASEINCFIYDANIYRTKVSHFSNNRRTFLKNCIKKELSN